MYSEPINTTVVTLTPYGELYSKRPSYIFHVVKPA